ncbi:MAG: hypothetical protein AAFR37_02665 [Cyanobacteria bacterium J06628_3]
MTFHEDFIKSTGRINDFEFWEWVVGEPLRCGELVRWAGSPT